MTRAHGMAAAALAAATLLGPAASFAGVGDAGQSVAGFLAVPAGAAAPGMGGASLAFGGDLAAGFANPAALGWIPGVAMAVSHAELPDGSRQEWGSVGGDMGIARTRWAISPRWAGIGSGSWRKWPSGSQAWAVTSQPSARSNSTPASPPAPPLPSRSTAK